MVFEQIEKAKSDYTDRYVMVIGNRPEYARFAGWVGQVKTVNMSGRALVEWIGLNEDIGWYDIDIDYLKVVEKPAETETEKPRPAAKPKAKKAAGELSPLEQLRQQGSSKPAKAKESLSPLELLRQQGGKKKESDDKPAKAAKPKAGLSPLEILRQQGGSKKSSD